MLACSGIENAGKEAEDTKDDGDELLFANSESRSIGALGALNICIVRLYLCIYKCVSIFTAQLEDWLLEMAVHFHVAQEVNMKEMLPKYR